MKIENYICDKCGKLIEGDIFELVPECIDRKDGESLLGIPDEMSDELYAITEGKHLCFKCIKVAITQALIPLFTPEAFRHTCAVNSGAYKNTDSIKETVKGGEEQEKNAETVQILKKYADSGMTIRETEAKIGISYSKIYHTAVKHGIVFKKAGSKQDVKQDKLEAETEVNEEHKKPEDNKPVLSYDNIVELYCNQGKNMHTIAKELGTTVEDVRNFIMKNKIFKNKNLQEKFDGTPSMSENSWNG